VAAATGHGFATSGNDQSVVMFDLKTFKVLGRIPAAEDADAIIYDRASNRVFTFNGDAHSSTVIDPEAGKLVTNVPLGGKPEYGASAATVSGANPTDTMKRRDRREKRATVAAPINRDVNNRSPWPPTWRITTVQWMPKRDEVLDYRRESWLLRFGAGVDGHGIRSSVVTFASNADGTLTVIHQDSPDQYHVAQTVQTAPAARNMGLDPTSHRLFLVSAKFGEAPAGGRGRGPVLPGTFTLMVIENDRSPR
jgi:hypothetical protein